MKTTEELNQKLQANIMLLDQLEKNNIVLIEKLKVIAVQQQELDCYKQQIDSYPL